MPYAIAFASGFAVDVLAVMWTRYVVSRRIAATTICSMALAVAQVCGIGAGARDWRLAIAFVLGCGLGTAVSLGRSR